MWVKVNVASTKQQNFLSRLCDNYHLKIFHIKKCLHFLWYILRNSQFMLHQTEIFFLWMNEKKLCCVFININQMLAWIVFGFCKHRILFYEETKFLIICLCLLSTYMSVCSCVFMSHNKILIRWRLLSKVNEKFVGGKINFFLLYKKKILKK